MGYLPYPRGLDGALARGVEIRAAHPRAHPGYRGGLNLAHRVVQAPLRGRRRPHYHGAGNVRAVAVHPGTEVEDDQVTAGDGAQPRPCVRQRRVGAGGDDRLEGDGIGAVPVQQVFQLPRHVALADTGPQQRQQLREGGVADGAGAGDGGHLGRLLARPQRGHRTGCRLQGDLRQPGTQLGPQRHGESGRLERQPPYPGFLQRRPQRRGRGAAMAPDAPTGTFLRRLLNVAHIRQQQGLPGGYDRKGRGPGEPGHVAQVAILQRFLTYQQQAVHAGVGVQPRAHRP